MYNNYNNDNFNNNPKPLFTNEFQNSAVTNSSEINYQNNVSVVNQDIPPVLEPIKNLSDANIASAPTMEVLDPMNIMPETFDRKEESKPVDPLDAYDNGINYNNPVVQPKEISFVQPEITHDFQMPEIENSSPQQNFNFGIQSQNNFNNISDSLISNQNNEVNSSIPSFNIEPQTEQKELNMAQDFTVNEVQTEKPTIISNEEEIKSETNYEIIEKTLKEEPKNPMLDLGIDNSYDDIDMLDIVDVDEENKEELDNTLISDVQTVEEQKEERPLLVDNINEIRNLINKIKEKGIKIELEEFDFEHMYQLIIKIEK